jgi:hypothetical protein
MTIRNVRRHLQLAAIFFLFSLVYVMPPVIAQDPPPPEEPPSPFDPRFGIVDSFVTVEEANAAGAGWSRIFLRWDVVQPGGPSDWKPANVPDTFLDAEIASGREIVAVLIGTPTWATDSGTSTAVPPIEFWGDFVSKIATQYKGRIKHWVIWHQPDVSDPTSPNYTWDGTAEDYYRLLKEAYFKIKAVDPEMEVHLAGLTYTWDQAQGNPQYLARLLDIIEADPQAVEANYFFDVVTYHRYYDPRQILAMITAVRSTLESYGLDKPIWLNETNAPPSEDPFEPLSAPADTNVTLEEQSAFVIQAFALALAGGAERVAFNKMRNETVHPESIEPYGLLRGDNSRRPAFNAFRVVTKHFAGTTRATWQQLGNVYIVTLDRGGQTTTVLWSMDVNPTVFPLNAIAPQALLVDESGNEQTIAANNGIYSVELPWAICSNGADCFIGGAPRLIVESGSPDQRAPLAAVPASAAPPTPTPPPPPTDTPGPAITPSPPPALTPTSTSIAPPTPFTTVGTQGGVTAEAPAKDNPPPMALPDPDLELTAGEAVPVPTATVVPPVSLSTIITPRRILWLFIVALVVFTVSYGVQVIIWYRLRR